ncbi:MAG TPA: hypothetical protein VIG64_01090 [Actinomycetota bacterium]|jgi:hypothetical protein
MLLPRFATPGKLTELSDAGRAAWSKRVSTLFDDVRGPSRHFYNPTKADTPANASTAAVKWPGSPGRLIRAQVGTPRRWEIADGNRDEQDEYCEWSVMRDDDGKIRRVTFTTETPDYYDHLMDRDQDLLLELYGNATGKNVTIDKLRNKHGLFVAKNQFNTRTDGTIVHLMQRSNNLRAAVILAAEATVLRKDRNGGAVTHPMSLVVCGGLGDETRHSDPQIAAAVNGLVAQKMEITLADPPGLYLDGLTTSGMETPDGADPQSFWSVERGAPGFAMRARFEVPDGHGYRVGDVTIGGRPIEFGAQLADRVQVRIAAVAKPGSFQPKRESCIKGSGL